MSNLFNPGIKYISVIDDVNDNAYIINGHDIDPGSTLEKEQLTRGVNARGGVKHVNESWSMTVNFADADTFNTLDGLTRGRNYKFTVVKLNGFVFWGELQTFSLNESSLFDPASEDYPYVLNATHISFAPDIEQKLNAVAPWEDDDSDNIADGFSLTGSPTKSFSGGVQSLGYNATAEFYLSQKILLPIEDVELKLGVTYDQLHDDGTNQIGIVFLDSAGAELSSQTQTVSSTGRKTLTVTTPANTYQVEVRVGWVTGATANTADVQIKDVSLRMDSTDFLSY